MPTAHPESRSSSRLATLALGLALLGAASMLYYHLGLFMPRVRQVAASRNLAGRYSFGLDFYPVWLTTQQWLQSGRDPYSTEMTREIQLGLFGRPLDAQIATDPRTDYRTFAYPAFTDILFWPAAQFPFRAVRVVCAGLLVVLTIAGIFLWTRALGRRLPPTWFAVTALLTVCSYPVLEGLYAAQLGLFVGFVLAASILALQRGRLLLAGALMALTTIKPQMALLAIVYLCLWSAADWRKRWRFLIGMFSMALLLVLAALLVWPRWMQSWIGVLLGYHRYAKPPLVGEVLAAPFGAPADSLISAGLIAILLTIAAVLTWRNRDAVAPSQEFWLTLSVLLSITTITLLPGQAVHDQVILLPGIFLLARERQQASHNWIEKMLYVITTALVLWPWFAALAVIALRPLLTHEQFYSKLVFALPLRTAAVFPFVVLALLGLAYRRQTATASLPR